MENQRSLPCASQSAGRYYLHSAIDRDLARAIVRCVDVIHGDDWPPKARTACVFTSLVLSGALRTLGFDARPVPVAVEGVCATARFGIGHPAYPLIRSGAWKGHLVCMVEDVLVDATISQARRWGCDAPQLIAVRCAQPWAPEAQVSLPSGGTLVWTAGGANQTWRQCPDAEPRVWRTAMMHLIAHLRSSAPSREAAA